MGDHDRYGIAIEDSAAKVNDIFWLREWGIYVAIIYVYTMGL